MSDIVERLCDRVDDAVQEITTLRAEIERLRAALRYALENGITTRYWGDDDDCGTHSCCGKVSYKSHADDCWTVKARAALKEKSDAV